jgi:hypothetical protein
VRNQRKQSNERIAGEGHGEGGTQSETIGNRADGHWQQRTAKDGEAQET